MNRALASPAKPNTHVGDFGTQEDDYESLKGLRQETERPVGQHKKITMDRFCKEPKLSIEAGLHGPLDKSLVFLRR